MVFHFFGPLRIIYVIFMLPEGYIFNFDFFSFFVFFSVFFCLCFCSKIKEFGFRDKIWFRSFRMCDSAHPPESHHGMIIPSSDAGEVGGCKLRNSNT